MPHLPIALRSASLAPPAVLAADAPTAPPAMHALLHAIGTAPSAERIESDIRKLVSFGTRHTLSDTKSDARGIGAARRWIHAEFERISAQCGGCLEVIDVGDTISGEERIPEPTEVVSVLAIQRGTADPARYVIMSGDIDTRVSEVMDFTSDSPGANDNESGVAGTPEADRVPSQPRFPGSPDYAELQGEEQRSDEAPVGKEGGSS